MRYVLGFFVVLSFGCGERLDRWSGEGCQPACVTTAVASDGAFRLRATCLDQGNEVGPCVEMGLTNVLCEAAGDIPTCDTDDGKPRCLNGPIERPLCGR